MGGFRRLDAFKKIPSDFLESWVGGAFISVGAATAILLLVALELSAFLQPKTTQDLVIDMGPPTELLKVTFNISFPRLSCEFAALDVSDALGKKRMNLTKTVTKTPLDLDEAAQGEATFDISLHPKPKYDEEYKWWENLNLTKPLSRADFDLTLKRYPVVVVNFFAPWCHWCQKLEPSWEGATQEVHEKYPEGADGRIRFARVDCTAEAALCDEHVITGYPSIRVFRKASDDVVVDGHHEHNSYTGDRTKDALVTFAHGLVAMEALGAEGRKLKHGQMKEAPKHPGCNIAGFVMVKKVPGTLHFTARDEAHSFDHGSLNMTHTVNDLHFGATPSAAKYNAMARLYPAGLSREWLDRMHGQRFVSPTPQHTHEHYLQVVRTSIQPAGIPRTFVGLDAFEYTVHSHSYASDYQPTAKFSYDLSPLQVVVREEPRRWYGFLTTLCGVVGGVFTVAGILDSVLYAGATLRRKMELGKHT